MTELEAMQDGFISGFVAAACNYDLVRSHASTENGCDTCKEYAAAARDHIDYPKAVPTEPKANVAPASSRRVSEGR